jgi:hypothetical protein
VTNSVDIKLSAHDAPPEQSALGTLKIERLDRQATQKFLESNTTKKDGHGRPCPWYNYTN